MALKRKSKTQRITLEDYNELIDEVNRLGKFIVGRGLELKSTKLGIALTLDTETISEEVGMGTMYGRIVSAVASRGAYRFVEQKLSSGMNFSDKSGGVDSFAYNLAEYFLPSYISSTHNITAPLLKYNYDPNDTPDEKQNYEGNVVVPIYKLENTYIFNLSRPQFREEYELQVLERDANDCPVTYRWDKRIIGVYSISHNDKPPVKETE